MPPRPEIFISTTSKDLKSCRQLVRDALLTLGCVPITQDHFAPDARTVREMLRARVAACDAVIHLAGVCYGAEPHQRGPAEPRRSYTQMEYDMARELKKPVYTFICADGFFYDTHDPEPDELRALQDAHRDDLQSRDDLYQPIRGPEDLALYVRELQTRVEHLTRDLRRTRSWLGRGVAVALAALALIGVLLVGLHERAQRTEQKVAQVNDELDLYRQAVRQVADRYGKDIDPGRKLTDQEKFDQALGAVAEQQKISVPELKTWMAVFVAQVRAKPGADFFDRALADFAEKRFGDAAADATKSAEQYRAQREASEKEAASANERGALARTNERRAWALVGDSESAAGHYAKAIDPYRQAVALIDKEREARVWCDAALKLENALWHMARYADAEPLAREVLEKRTALLGAENRDTLLSLNDLGNVLSDKGDNAAAEPVYRRCLEARERTLGADHPDTLASINNLAAVLDAKGDYRAAEPLFRRCLEARERTLGKEHPDTLASMNNLAFVLDEKGDSIAAESLYRQCLAARERTLGADHPLTLNSVNNVAVLLAARGDNVAAEALYRRCMDARVRTLGEDHPDTLMTISNLAQLIDAEGNYADAETLYLRAQAGMQRVFAPEDPYRLDLDYYFSLMRQKQGRLADALPLAEEAAAGARKTFPADSPNRIKYEKNAAELRTRLANAPVAR